MSQLILQNAMARAGRDRLPPMPGERLDLLAARIAALVDAQNAVLRQNCDMAHPHVAAIDALLDAACSEYDGALIAARCFHEDEED